MRALCLGAFNNFDVQHGHETLVPKSMGEVRRGKSSRSPDELSELVMAAELDLDAVKHAVNNALRANMGGA